MKILDVHFSFQRQSQGNWQSSAFEFHYFLNSNGTFRINDVSFPIHKETLFLLSPGQFCEIILDQLDQPLGFFSLIFEVTEENPFSDALFDPSFQTLFPFSWDSEGRIFFEEIKKKITQVDNPYKIQSAEWSLMALISNLLGEFYNNSGLSKKAQTEFNLHVEQSLELLQNSVFTSLTLKDLCSQLKITEEHLIRLFKKAMNMTPMKYLKNLKIEAASSLLLTTDLSVKEIAWRLGFSSPYHFSRNFKLHSGCSPTEYRANYFLHNPQGLQRF